MPVVIDGPKGTTPEYRKNWIKTFKWTDADRARYASLISGGLDEDKAFYEVQFFCSVQEAVKP